MSQKVTGNIKGLSPSEKRNLERLYERAIDANDIISLDFAREIFHLSVELRRRIGVLISREGRVEEVFVGSREILYLPPLGRYRLGAGRLRRLRLVYSDLTKPDTVVIPSDIYGDLEKLRLDMVVAVKERRNRVLLKFAYNTPVNSPSDRATMTEEVSDLSTYSFDFLEFIEGLERQHIAAPAAMIEQLPDSGLLMGVYPPRHADPEGSLTELRELCRTAGINVVDTVVQHRKPDPRTLLGKGKLEEIILMALRLGVEILVFDTELKPSQWRVITNATELKVLDRSMVILDIFAQRATSSDGTLQVELAQLKYNLPRLVEKDVGLSRLTGGIGGRGPGETKLEIGRRRIRDRIAALEKKIDKLGERRSLRRKRRRANEIPLVAILGYTNAGKSTLFNTLTGGTAFTENKLFATLDPTQGKLFIPPENEDERGLPVILSDTVGFIRDLPDELTNAFRATLEELYEASLLLHVVDASNPQLRDQMNAVNDILKEMEITDIPHVLVFNKTDLMDPEEVDLLCKEHNAIAVSAVTGDGIDKLKSAIGQKLAVLNTGTEPPSAHY